MKNVSQPVSRRDTTIDVARALAIVAIVAGHVLRGLSAGDLVDSTARLYSVTDLLLYTFHLSVFAFLAGLFLQRGLQNQGTWKYLWSRDATFLYLYILWSMIQGGAKLLTSTLVNTPVTILDVLDLVHPEGHLWFLPWLIVVMTLTALLRPWTSRLRAGCVLALSLCASFAAWGYSGTVIGPEGISLWVFFVSGAVLGDERFRSALSRCSLSSSVLVAAVLVGIYVAGVSLLPVTAPTVGFESRTLVSVAIGAALSVCGGLAVFALARILSHALKVGEILAWVGRRSLEIYLAHGVALSGARIILVLLDVTSLPVHLVVGTLSGVLAPLGLWWLMRCVRFPWLFSAPSGILPRKPVRAGEHLLR